MPTLPALLRFVSMFFHLVRDAIRFLLLGMRSSAALKAENLCLRKQLALYLERPAKPRRGNDAPRLTSAQFACLERSTRHRQAGDHDSLASEGFSAVLAYEVETSR